MNVQSRGELRQRRAVVIGSGPAGLTAALALAARGARVHLLEDGPEPGASFRPSLLEGFAFEPWPLFITDPQPLADLFAACGHRISDFVTLRRPDPLCRVWLESENRFDWPARPAEFLEKVEAMEGRRGRFRGFLHRGAAIAHARDQLALRRSSPLFPLLALWHGRHWFPPLGTDARAVARMAGNHGALHRMTSALSLINGVPPAAGHGELARIVWLWVHQGGWLVEGGMLGLLKGLLRLAELVGIRIHCNAKPERILLQNGRVRRVEGIGFRPMTASIVVGTERPGDVASICYPKPAEVPRRWRFPLRPGPGRTLPLFRWDLVKGKGVRELARFTLFPAPDPRETNRFLVRWKVPSFSPDILVVRTTERVEDTATDDGNPPRVALSVLCRVPPSSPRFRWSDDVAQNYKRLLAQTLEERGLKTFSQEIVAERIVHPGSGGGVPGGGTACAPSFLSSWSLPGNRLAELGGVYLAGPFSHPGGEFAGELRSGLLAAERAVEDARA